MLESEQWKISLLLSPTATCLRRLLQSQREEADRNLASWQLPGGFFFLLPLLSTDFFCTSRQVLMKVNSSKSTVLCCCTVSEKPGRNKWCPYQNIGLLKTSRHASHLHMSGGGPLVDIWISLIDTLSTHLQHTDCYIATEPRQMRASCWVDYVMSTKHFDLEISDTTSRFATSRTDE